MRRPLKVVLPVIFLSSIVLSQTKVAEGEYLMHSGSGNNTSETHTLSRWTLYVNTTGSYRLESEVQHVPKDVRVVQAEELDEMMVPKKIEYDLYLKGDTKPNTVLECSFVGELISCGGISDQGPDQDSAPFKRKGATLLWVDGLSAIDTGWLLGGAVNMATSMPQQSTLTTTKVAGGVALSLTDKINVAYLETIKLPNGTLTTVLPEHYTEWQFSSDPPEKIELTGTEKIQAVGTTILAKHYIVSGSSQTYNIWTAGPGLVVKMAAPGMGEWSLTNYKQHKSIVPEIKVQ